MNSKIRLSIKFGFVWCQTVPLLFLVAGPWKEYVLYFLIFVHRCGWRFEFLAVPCENFVHSGSTHRTLRCISMRFRISHPTNLLSFTGFSWNTGIFCMFIFSISYTVENLLNSLACLWVNKGWHTCRSKIRERDASFPPPPASLHPYSDGDRDNPSSSSLSKCSTKT